MSDDFDGCECVWSQEYAMQRLINFIRQNQNACSDTECFDVTGRSQQQVQGIGRSGDDSGFSVTMIFLIVAMFMYILNPSTWGSLTSNKRSGGRRDNDQDGSPPPPQPPPPAIN
ncbi:small integral membrane protein 14 [Drosophila ficusphila]|uniref:small integral membrane protein 14 n=1 Tax=Drosophila ficusphila TaxID=30025 RepID=UPI0007E6427D|nr:small integral membrane protein 14 [Drosophila ficusphila]XP_017061964.1 small integral membrane protein 14 [Drosophila ficusphila]XP_017061965.1 small integral membrane protein 14 [Drosophila ficusphila]XP_017061966.1 small integral membrane protein 14 [Drosophila ficusphila]XP_017061967.1 small integral membrane protein 14 [Drosophila ficusphila]